METLPNELILLILNNIPEIKDMRSFTRTCKTYHTITKHKMSKIKYIMFDVYFNNELYEAYDFMCVCDTLKDCRLCLIEYLKNKSDKKYEIVISKRYGSDYYKYAGYSNKNLLLIEETIINDIESYLKN